MTTVPKIEKSEDEVLFASFLEFTPLHTEEIVALDEVENAGNLTRFEFILPNITLYCTGEHCKREMFFKSVESTIAFYNVDNNFKFKHLIYTCKNCHTRSQHYFIRFLLLPKSKFAVYKIGEDPEKKIHIPASVQNFLEDDKHHFLKGLRSETYGLGIAASAYYRRVVESQKNRLLDKVIEIGKKQNFPSDAIKLLEDAKTENQFSSIFDTIKIPDSLFINSQNPFKLLYQALSADIHEMDDDIALKRAQAARKILIPFVQEIKRILKDEEGIKEAMAILQNLKS